jgi:hypothetical protein
MDSITYNLQSQSSLFLEFISVYSAFGIEENISILDLDDLHRLSVEKFENSEGIAQSFSGVFREYFLRVAPQHPLISSERKTPQGVVISNKKEPKCCTHLSPEPSVRHLFLKGVLSRS